MSIDEHLFCYIIDQVGFTNESYGKQKQELVGTRDEIERKLIEFLYNLKYYSTRWLRAKLYAEIAGFIIFKDSTDVF